MVVAARGSGDATIFLNLFGSVRIGEAPVQTLLVASGLKS